LIRHEHIKNSSDIFLLHLVTLDALVRESIQELSKTRKAILLHTLTLNGVIHQAFLAIKDHAACADKALLIMVVISVLGGASINLIPTT
jgi:hypothetical protein